jgi:hypothetical protein
MRAPEYVPVADQGDSGDQMVRLPLQFGELGVGLSYCFSLVQKDSTVFKNLIGADDDCIFMICRDSLRLGGGKTAGEICRRYGTSIFFQCAFIDIGWVAADLQSGSFKQFAADG